MLNEAELEGIVEAQLGVMPHRCTILRNVAEGESPYGGPAEPDWEVVATDEPCRLVFERRVVYGLRRDERVESLVWTGYVLWLCPDANVSDRNMIRVDDEDYTIRFVSSGQGWRSGLVRLFLERAS